MSLADTYRDNTADCAFLAERAEDEDTKHALMPMEAAWRTLANQQEILDCQRWKKPAA
jgi:predicted ATPase